MANQAAATPPRRPKMDGSSDSICLNCLATVVAKHDHEADKSNVESRHICHPYFSDRRTPVLLQSA
ncbi:hypothetical protein HDF10_000275 [Edaphobacter lichenicola]|uniref:Uncharacterized protein n=1 Tax=Tunturiibacter lichenicola TaxID=2051959 RepID=A0A7W8J4G4_9BACT|nr:hypothetical protein [Edaphobacter lichenicola]